MYIQLFFFGRQWQQLGALTMRAPHQPRARPRTARAPPPPSPPRQSEDRIDALTIANAVLSVLHSALAIATGLSTKNPDLRAPVFRIAIGLNFTMEHEAALEEISKRVNASELTGLDDLFGAHVEPVNGLPIASLAISFFAVTALFHAGAATLWARPYRDWLARKANPLRWIEYAITAPLMWLILAQAFGLVSRASLTLSAAMIAVTMASGMQTEFVARPAADGVDAWSQPLFVRLAFMAPGALLFGAAAAVVVASLGNIQGDLPSFIVPVVVAQLLLFSSFAGVLAWQQCHPPSMWIYGEYAFQALSLVSKAVLGIVLIVNVLIYEQYACIFDDASC